jgi:CPA1 family monovalent cation:H+ antiporter
VTDVAHVVVQTVAVALAAASVSGIARRIGVPAPIALVAVGLGVSVLAALLPVHVPAFDVDPELVLYVFLPPLLYSAALESSYLNIRRNLRPILHLSVGLVVFTTAAVACVAHWFAGLPWVAAFVLGAVVAPPDAVAATALGRTLGLPRRLLTILGGESLFNDATALTLLRLGILAATAGAVTYSEGARTFVVAAVGGVAIGLLLAPAIHQLRIRLREPVLENAFAVLLPFAVYVLAETFDASGVLAVVVLGLYLGHREAETTFAVRLQARAVWRMIDFLLESVVFLLIGLEIAPIVQRALRVADGGELVVYGLAVLAVVILARIVWVFGARLLPRGFSLRSRTRDPGPSWSEATVLSWAGMRGVVSLAAALAIPRAVEDRQFPGLELVLYLTVCVVFGTLVLHGLTLPWLVRRLGVAGGEGMADVLAEAQAQHAAARAAIDRLDALLAQGVELPDGVEQRLRDHAEHRANSAWERLGRGGEMTPPAGTRAPEMETPAEAFRRLRRDMLTAERDVFVDMRNSGRIDDEVLRRVLNELDLEEAMLARD